MDGITIPIYFDYQKFFKFIHKRVPYEFKDCVCTYLLKASFSETTKMFYISLPRLFSLLRKLKFEILDVQVSWRHQMPKHETRKRFHWIIWEVNSLLMKFAQFISYYKRKSFIRKFYKTCDLKTSSTLFCVCKELNKTYWKWKLKRAYKYFPDHVFHKNFW